MDDGEAYVLRAALQNTNEIQVPEAAHPIIVKENSAASVKH
jgi:hypothetical protein